MFQTNGYGDGGFNVSNVFPQNDANNLELANEYESELSELTFNSKPIINNLTIIAGENTNAANQIVNIIENRVRKVESDKKLPSLYLMDSICKNIRGPYINLFEQKVVSLFCDTYAAVDETTRNALVKLLETWTGLFSSEALQQIQTNLKSMQQRSKIPTKNAQQRPNRGGTVIVNPNFVAKKMSQQNSSAAPKRGNQQTINNRNVPKPPPKSTSRVDEIIQGQGRSRTNFQTPVTSRSRVPQPKSHTSTLQQDTVNHPTPQSTQQPPYLPPDIAGLQFQIQQQMSVILSAIQAQLASGNLPPQDQLSLLTQLQKIHQLQQQTQFSTSGPVLQSHIDTLRALYPFTSVGTNVNTGLLPTINLPTQDIPPHQISGYGLIPSYPPSSSIPNLGYNLQTQWPAIPTQALNPADLLNNLAAYGLLKPNGPPIPTVVTGPSTPSIPTNQLPLPRPIPPTANIASKRQRTLRDPWASDSLKRRDESLINELYFDFPLQCKNCGLRFDDRPKMDLHLDWHFLQNRKEKEKTRKAMSRGWHPSKEEWITSTEILDKSAVPFPFGNGSEELQPQQQQKVQSVPADDNQKKCPKCGESFEPYYDSELDEWMYKDTLSIEGDIFHVKCSQLNEIPSEIKKVDEPTNIVPAENNVPVAVNNIKSTVVETISMSAIDMPPLEEYDHVTLKRPPPDNVQPEEVKYVRVEEQPTIL